MRKVLVAIIFLFGLQYVGAQYSKYDSLKNLISSAKDDSTKFYRTVDLIWDYVYSIPDSAVLYVQQNMLLAQKMKSEHALLLGYAQYTVLEQINGNYTGALQYCLQHLRIAERTNNFLSICEAYFTLGDASN